MLNANAHSGRILNFRNRTHLKITQDVVGVPEQENQHRMYFQSTSFWVCMLFPPSFGLSVCLFPGGVGGYIHQKHATYLTFLISSLQASSLKWVSVDHSLQWRAQSENSQKQGNLRTAQTSPSSAQQAFRTSITFPHSW